MARIVTADARTPGDRGYLVHGGRVAFVIDLVEVFPSHGPGSSCALGWPGLATAAELHERLVAGEWVVDVRPRAAYAAAHLAGTLHVGLDGDFAGHLRRLMPVGTPLTVLAADRTEVDAAVRGCVGAGLVPPVAYAVGDPIRWVAGSGGLAVLPLATFGDLAAAGGGRGAVVLDVRDDAEYARAHLAGVRHIPLGQLPGRFGEVPHGEVWVHCADGSRAMVAASLLTALGGRHPVVVDDRFAPRRLAAMPGLVVLPGPTPACRGTGDPA